MRRHVRGADRSHCGDTGRMHRLAVGSVAQPARACGGIRKADHVAARRDRHVENSRRRGSRACRIDAGRLYRARNIGAGRRTGHSRCSDFNLCHAHNRSDRTTATDACTTPYDRAYSTRTRAARRVFHRHRTDQALVHRRQRAGQGGRDRFVPRRRGITQVRRRCGLVARADRGPSRRRRAGGTGRARLRMA